MKLITKDTDYAIKSLCAIAEVNRIVSVPELVEILDIPRPFLRKILQTLHKKGFLISVKGHGGGFKTGISLSEITLSDMMHVFQGPLELNDCLLHKDACPDIKNCLLRKKISGIEKKMTEKIKSITLESLVRVS